jgi:hypothetical protein
MREGKYMISKAKIHEDVVLRPVIFNPKTTESTLDGLLKEVLRVGDEMSIACGVREETLMPERVLTSV